jgi:hypothetical protein
MWNRFSNTFFVTERNVVLYIRIIYSFLKLQILSGIPEPAVFLVEERRDCCTYKDMVMLWIQSHNCVR